MRVRHIFALAALSLLLSACGADAITAPETRAPETALLSDGGWMGGSGATMRPHDAESAN